MEPYLSLTDILLVTLVVSIGAALQASVGYGMGLIAIPFLVMIDPDFIPGAMLLSAFSISIFIILREKRTLDFNGLQWAVIGRVIGTFAAAWLITMISENAMILLSGFLVLIAVVITAGGFRIPQNRLNLGIAGALGGLMGTIASIGGPPMALVYQHESGARIRTSLSGFFLAGTLISIRPELPSRTMLPSKLLILFR